MVKRRAAVPASGSRVVVGARRKIDVRAINVYHRALLATRDAGLLPVLETPLGRWVHTGELSVIEGKAAFLIGEIYGRYDRVMGRSRSVRSPSWESGRKGAAGKDLDPEFVATVTADFETLQANLPRPARAAIEALCVEGLCASKLYLDDIRLVLRNVAKAFKIAGDDDAPAPGIIPNRRVPKKDRPRQAKGRWDDGSVSSPTARHSDPRAAADFAETVKQLQANAEKHALEKEQA